MNHRSFFRAKGLPVGVLLLCACVGGGPLAGQDPSPQEAPDQEAVADETSSSLVSELGQRPEGDNQTMQLQTVDPDEEGWIVDEATQRRYRIEKLPKREGAYRWLNDKEAQFPLGVTFEVVKHDEQWFWVKAWESKGRKILEERMSKPKAEEGSKDAPAKDQEDLAVEEDPLPQLPEEDRLQLEAFDRGLPDSGQWRNGFDVADMNEDGHLDIVFGASRKGRAYPNIFLGDGKGDWKRWRTKFPPLRYDYGDAAVADFDGDGHLDVAFGIHLSGIVALRGDGTGRFSTWSEGIELDRPGKGGAATSFSSRALEVADWNRDGRPDIVALGEGPKGVKQGLAGVEGQMINTARGHLVYLNQGDGTWKPHRPYTFNKITELNFGDDFKIEDLDRDGHLDVVSATSRMGNREILDVGQASGELEHRTIDKLRSRGQISTVDTADVDQDGRGDLLVGYRSNKQGEWRTGVDLFLGRADWQWERKAVMGEASRKGTTAVASGDVDGDGHFDVVALTGEGEVLLFLGDGEGFFKREISPELPPSQEGCRGYGLKLVDLDGDAKDEVIAAFAGESVGYPGIPRYHQPGCARGGSLRVWKAVNAAASATDTAATESP